MDSSRPWEWDGEEQKTPGALLHLVPPQNRYQRHVKRVMDVTLGLLLMILLAPLTLISMCLVKLVLGSPVIYRQQRVGLGGGAFELYKLRTMLDDRRNGQSAAYEGPERRSTHKSRTDPRVVPIGSVMRSLRLDEIPQLWNVIKGDMSLVGPRPELPDIVAKYEDWQHHRHVVKPGLTGLWQVSAPPDKLMHECTEIDLEYVSNISFVTDLSILMRTPVAMFGRRGF